MHTIFLKSYIPSGDQTWQLSPSPAALSEAASAAPGGLEIQKPPRSVTRGHNKRGAFSAIEIHGELQEMGKTMKKYRVSPSGSC